MMRYLFLVLEFGAFLSILVCNALFLSVRMLTPNQLNLVKVEPRRQMPSIDTMDSLSLLISQYSSFCVPFLLIMVLAQRMQGYKQGESAANSSGLQEFQIGQGI